MAIVFIPHQMRDLTGGVAHLEVEAKSLRQAIRALDEQFPGIAARLTAGEGLSPGIQVSIDGAISSRGLLAPIKPTSEVHFLPAIGGG
ncbi:MAG: MoaD/ThiS family protein [Pirellulales bacterium]|nr:MoaD/ThiS family protein [Pirellulales bacterium]